MPQDFSDGTPPITLHFRFPPPAVGGVHRRPAGRPSRSGSAVGGNAAVASAAPRRPPARPAGRPSRSGSAAAAARSASAAPRPRRPPPARPAGRPSRSGSAAGGGGAAAPPSGRGPAGKTGWEALEKWVGGGRAAAGGARPPAPLRQDRLGGPREVGRRRRRRRRRRGGGPSGKTGWEALEKWVGGGGSGAGGRGGAAPPARPAGRPSRSGSAARAARGRAARRPRPPPARPAGRPSRSGSAAVGRRRPSRGGRGPLRQDRLGGPREVGRPGGGGAAGAAAAAPPARPAGRPSRSGSAAAERRRACARGAAALPATPRLARPSSSGSRGSASRQLRGGYRRRPHRSASAPARRRQVFWSRRCEALSSPREVRSGPSTDRGDRSVRGWPSRSRGGVRWRIGGPGRAGPVDRPGVRARIVTAERGTSVLRAELLLAAVHRPAPQGSQDRDDPARRQEPQVPQAGRSFGSRSAIATGPKQRIFTAMIDRSTSSRCVS